MAFTGEEATVDVDELRITSAGVTRFDGVLTIDGLVNIDTDTFDLNVPLTATGEVTVTAAGPGDTAVGAVIEASGSVLFDGTGPLSLGDDIVVGADSDIEVRFSAVTLTSDVHLDAGTGVGSVLLGG